MADTRTTTIEETFGLIAVEGYGGKVRLWTEAELWPWIYQEVSVGRKSRPTGGRDKGQHCLAIWGRRSPSLLEGRGRERPYGLAIALDLAEGIGELVALAAGGMGPNPRPQP